MAANRFNQLLNKPAYVSTYVPLPLDLIAQQGANKQKESDDTKKKLADSVLENIKSISEHDPYRNKYVQDFNQQAEALVGDASIDFGSSAGKAKVYNLIKEHANNPNLQVIARSIDNKKQTLEDWSAVQKAGKGAYWNDPTLRDQKLESIGINPYLNQDGTPKEYDRKIAYSVEDHNKPVYDLFDKIKDSGEIKAYANFGGDKTYIQSGKNGWEGVDAKTIKAVADRNVDTFKTTQGGQDFLRKFQFDHAEQLAQMSPEERYKAENTAATNHLYNIGNAYIHNKETQDRDLQATALLGAKYEEEQANKTTTRESEAIKNDALVDITANLEFDDKGGLKAPVFAESAYKDPTTQGVYETNIVSRGTGKQGFDMEKAKKDTDIIAKIQTENPELRRLTPQKTVEAYRKALKAVSAESMPLHEITNQAAKQGIGTTLARSKKGREFYIQDGDGTIGTGDWTSVIKELGITEEEFDKVLESGIGGYTQAGKTAGAYYVEVPVSDTQKRRVLISPAIPAALTNPLPHLSKAPCL